MVWNSVKKLLDILLDECNHTNIWNIYQDHETVQTEHINKLTIV